MAPAPRTKSRISSVDALRGLVMILMALDHVRDFIHADAVQYQPDDLARTTAALFFTRWVTHFCAPVFMFTAGMGAFFWLRRGRTTGQLAVFLATRGLWLILLDLTSFQLVLKFGLHSPAMILSVLWALGWSMLALALLARLPVRALAVFCIATIALHNLADSVQASQFGPAAWVWNILHQPGPFRVAGSTVIIGYPLVPWIAVMAAGFCFGRVMLLEPEQRRWWLTRSGAAITAAFLIIRGVNVYGDPFRWSSGFLSFLRCTKYPPSLDFLLMTLGPAMLLLSWLDRVPLSDKNPLLVFGRVPLFYFIVHLYAILALTIGLRARTPHLWVVYAWWIAVVALMYPLCLWYGRTKQRKSWWWLSYIVLNALS